MKKEEIEDLKQVHVKTYVAAGAMNIEHIEHVENLFPGSADLIAKAMGGEKKKNEFSDDDLRNMINKMLPKITSNRMWFAIVKVLMLRGKVAYDDFDGALKLIEKLFPAGFPQKFDPADLKKLHDGCFRLPLSEWKKETSPYKRDAEFKQMYYLAADFDALFS